MKKLLIFPLLLFLTGCYDYTELNDLSIVSTIIIDKSDNYYDISFEVLSDNEKNEEAKSKSIIITGKGNTLVEAITDTIKKTPKQAYLAHLKVVIVSKLVAQENLKEICSYLLRDPYVRNEFYLVIADEEKASNILDVKSGDIPVISDYIYLMLKNNKKGVNNIANKNFENIIIDIFEKGIDTTIPVIKKEDNKIEISSNSILDDFKLKEILNSKDSTLLNLLTNNTSNILLTYNCPTSSKKISLSIYDEKTTLNIKDNKLIINLEPTAEILEYNCDEDLKDADTFKKFNNYYSKEIKKDINKLYKVLLNNKSDILGIGKLMFIKNRYFKENTWTKIKYTINVNLKINKEGLIYEVTNGN